MTDEKRKPLILNDKMLAPAAWLLIVFGLGVALQAAVESMRGVARDAKYDTDKQLAEIRNQQSALDATQRRIEKTLDDVLLKRDFGQWRDLLAAKNGALAVPEVPK